MTEVSLPSIESPNRTTMLPIWLSYILSLVLASVIYVSLLVIRFYFLDRDIKTSIFVAESMYFFGGFLIALAILIIPWTCIATLHWLIGMTRSASLIYFVFMGALLFFCLNCLTSINLSFVPDQTTRLQDMFTAAHNQGFYFLISGGLFGATYCILGVPKDPVIW
jgi:hypothetical protein